MYVSSVKGSRTRGAGERERGKEKSILGPDKQRHKRYKRGFTYTFDHVSLIEFDGDFSC